MALWDSHSSASSWTWATRSRIEIALDFLRQVASRLAAGLTKAYHIGTGQE